MTKSANSKASYSARRELRLRRDKTAALLMPVFIAPVGADGDYRVAAHHAVLAADILLAELDRTRKDLDPQNDQREI
jgi:hypothetical protein